MSMVQEIQKEISSITKATPSLLNEAKDDTSYIDRSSDVGLINKKSKSSIIVRGTGDIGLAANTTTKYQLNASSGYAVEHSIESDTIAVRKRLEVDEIIINDHKLNPALYELSDMRQMFDNTASAIGNLTVFSTVLVKAWEPTLKKWVLIRRLARTPVFSPILNLPDAPDQLSLNTDISDEIMKFSVGGKK